MSDIHFHQHYSDVFLEKRAVGSIQLSKLLQIANDCGEIHCKSWSHFCTITFVLIHRRTPFGTIDLFLRHHLLLNSMISTIARVHCREDNIGRNAHRRTLVRIVLGGPCAETTAVSWVLAEPLFNDQTPAMAISTHAQTIALREVGDANDPLPGVPGCLRAAPNRRLLPWSLVWGLRIAASSPSASSLAWGF